MKYTQEQVKIYLSNLGFTAVNSYVNCKTKMILYDKNFYFYFIDFDHLLRNRKPQKFHISNPFTLHNIRIYLLLETNGTVRCHSTAYVGIKDKMCFSFKGNKFYSTFSNIQSQINKGTIYRVSKEKHRRIKRKSIEQKYKELCSFLSTNGYFIITPLDEFQCGKNKITIRDAQGYLFQCSYSNLKSGKRPLKFHKTNPYSINNINKYFELFENSQYECLDDIYVNRNSALTFRHNTCGRSFISNLMNVYRTKDDYDHGRFGTRCPHCCKKSIESKHAIVLKQIFQHEFPNTQIEDKSCINPKTNMPLPTDIVNHDLKIAIEIQSGFHDRKYQKSKDLIKKKYWVSRGYSFFDPDIRDYSIIGMIQLFFPSITDIPEYVDMDYRNSLDIIKIQNLLNSGMKVSEISSELNISSHKLYDTIYSGGLSYPDGYISADKTPILQLDVFENVLNRFESIATASKETGISYKNIISAICKNNLSGGYMWVRERDYLEGKYIIPPGVYRMRKYYVPVCLIDHNGTVLKEYENIIYAESDTKIPKHKIYEVAIGARNICYNTKWKFK